MQKPLNKSFSCKLNKKYWDALKWEAPKVPKVEVTDAMVLKHFGYNTNPYQNNKDLFQKLINEYKYDMSHPNEDNEWGDDGSNMNCCGLNELTVGGDINKDTPENRNKIANRIKQLFNNDNRVFITGLPISKVGEGSSDYNFRNYRVTRKILMDFGMKQVTPRTYVNANSNNRLSVLVGQF